jgi:predicted solute-binding protein
VASLLAEGELDVGLIPSIEIARLPGLRVVPDLCVGVDGPSETALLLLERPVEEVKRVAVDRHSRSAPALLQIVLLEVFGRQVETVPQQQRVAAIPAGCDGALLLAEAALKASWEGSRHLHLTGHWRELTGLPFVFGIWAVRAGIDLPDLVFYFKSSLRYGLTSLETLSREAGLELGVRINRVRRYLEEQMRFVFGEREQAGLREFLERAHRHGLAPQPDPIWFLS